jgi:hypothetical protein
MLHEREFVSLEPGSKTQSLSDRFVADSPLEGDGFEPPVRLGEANGPRALRLVLDEPASPRDPGNVI